MKILLVSPKGISGAPTGRDMLADLNTRAVVNLFGQNLVQLSLAASYKPVGWRHKLAALMGWLDGLNYELERRCLDIIESKGIDSVYIEGSNYGRLARAIRINAPKCKVVTFFHNVESRFFWGALKAKPSIKAMGVLLANWVAEMWAVRYSHRIICLNSRDSLLLQRVYGRAATDIHPLCVDGVAVRAAKPAEIPFGLFVGGAFYANLQGAQWLAREVAPRLSCQIVIVGKGFERYRSELEAHPNITVVGTVESVACWYERASFVVAPIFDGSGMKTKVAEALMYGKPVIGTPEAFMGYEAVGERAGILCHDASSFAAAVDMICAGEKTFDAHELQALFNAHYSLAAKQRSFAETFRQLAMQDTL